MGELGSMVSLECKSHGTKINRERASLSEQVQANIHGAALSPALVNEHSSRAKNRFPAADVERQIRDCNRIESLGPANSLQV